MSFDRLFNKIFKHKNQKLLVVFDRNDKVWFKAKDIALMLKYKKTDEAIRKNVNRKEKIYVKKLKFVVRPKGIPNRTIFINESGLYSLMLGSRLPTAIKFKNWVTRKVLPQIMRTGKYIATQKLRKQLKNMRQTLKEHKDRINVLENNQKRRNSRRGGYIYILQMPNLNKFVKDVYKIGQTWDLNKRLNSYDTSSPDKFKPICAIKVSSPDAMEHCLKSKLNKYIYRRKKEYYKCSLNKIVDSIQKCCKFTEDKCYKCSKCKQKSNSGGGLSNHLQKHSIDPNKIDRYEIIC